MRYVVLVSICFVQIVFGNLLKTKIYKNFHSYSACIRFLNGTHQIGCSSAYEGNVGVLHHLKDIKDMVWLIDKGPHKPYIVLLTDNRFTKVLVSRLKRSGKVNGMIILKTNHTDDKPSHFSPDKSCPNRDNCRRMVWNPHGNALMFVDFNIPIVLLHHEQDVEFLINKCYKQHNAPRVNGDARSYPLCAVQLKVAMDAAKDTPTCLRRADPITLKDFPEHRCSPLADYNIYSFVQHHNNLMADSVVVLSARLDAFSLFVDIVPAGDSTVTGLITFLAAAEAIGKVKNQLMLQNRPIVFILFNGESFDYIGSSKMLYEMERNNLHHGFQSEHIYTWFELSQVGFGNVTWLHRQPINITNALLNTQVMSLITKIQARARDAGLLMDVVPSGQPLPPASVQTFLAKRSFPSLVLADHMDSFANKYYNSRYDTIAELLQWSNYNDTVMRLTRLATTIANVLYQTSTETVLRTIQANESTVRGLLYCFLMNSQCEMFNRTLENKESINHLSNKTYSFYIGDATSRNPLTHLVWRLLTYYLGDHDSTVSKKRCKEFDETEKVFKYTWMQGEMVGTTQHRQGVCVMGNVHYTEAMSPAFDDMKYDWTSRLYSTWSQSVWGNDAMIVRAFMVPGFHTEVLTLLVGICGFSVCLMITIVINRRSYEIFEQYD